MSLQKTTAQQLMKTLSRQLLTQTRQFSTNPLTPPRGPSQETINQAVRENYETNKQPFFKKMKNKMSTYCLNHQPQLRIFSLAAASYYILKWTNAFTMDVIVTADGMGIEPSTTAGLLYAGGAINALVALGLIKGCAHILSLAGQPSEAVIQEVLRRTIATPELEAKLGAKPVIGKFCSVSCTEGSFRFLNTKQRQYKDWLAYDAHTFTKPLPMLLFPKFATKIIGKFPGFQTVAWNHGAEERAVVAATGSEKPVAPTLSAEDAKSRAADLKTDADYSGWERYWKPRRLQMALHITGPNDNGLLLAEVEKSQTGEGEIHSGGFTRYKTLQYVSLVTGETLTIAGPERPTLLSHAHISKLFDTIPVAKVKVDETTASYIIAEGKYAKEMKEKEKADKEAAKKASEETKKSD